MKKGDYISLEEAITKLGRTRLPQTHFYMDDGLIRAPIGAYRVVELDTGPNKGTRILVFAHKASDLSSLDAMEKATIYPIAAEDKDNPNWIDDHIHIHSRLLPMVLLSRKSLFRMDEDSWINGMISYRLYPVDKDGDTLWEIHAYDERNEGQFIYPSEKRPNNLINVWEPSRMSVPDAAAPNGLRSLFTRQEAEDLVVTDFHENRRPKLLKEGHAISQDEARSWLTSKEQKLHDLFESTAIVSKSLIWMASMGIAMFHTMRSPNSAQNGTPFKIIGMIGKIIGAPIRRLFRQRPVQKTLVSDIDAGQRQCAALKELQTIQRMKDYFELERCFPPVPLSNFGKFLFVPETEVTPYCYEPLKSLSERDDIMDYLVDPLQGHGFLVVDLRNDTFIIQKPNGISLDFGHDSNTVTVHYDPSYKLAEQYQIPEKIEKVLRKTAPLHLKRRRNNLVNDNDINNKQAYDEFHSALGLTTKHDKPTLPKRRHARNATRKARLESTKPTPWSKTARFKRKTGSQYNF